MATRTGAGAELTQRMKAGTEIQQQQSPEKTLFSFLSARKNFIAQVLPSYITADKMIDLAFIEIRKNPKLMQCSPQSLVGAIMLASQLGCAPGPLGHCYLVPFWNGKTQAYDVQFQLGYRGMLKLVRNSGEVGEVYGYVVHAKDQFSISYGLRRDLHHIPSMEDDPGAPIGAYTVAALKSGERDFCYMRWVDIMKRRDQYSKNSRDKSGSLVGPWATEPEAMAIKTVLRAHFKWLPMSVEAMQTIESSDNAVAALANDGSISIEVAPPDVVEADPGVSLPSTDAAPALAGTTDAVSVEG